MYKRELGIFVKKGYHIPFNELPKNIDYHFFGEFDEITLSSINDFYEDNNIFLHLNNIDEFSSKVYRKYSKIIYILSYTEELLDLKYRLHILPYIEKLYIQISKNSIQEVVNSLNNLLYKQYYQINGYYPYLEFDVSSIKNIKNDVETLFNNISYNLVDKITLWNCLFYPIVDRVNIINKLEFLDSYKNNYYNTETRMYNYYGKIYNFPIKYEEFIRKNNINNDSCKECKSSFLCSKPRTCNNNMKNFYYEFSRRLVTIK